MSSPQTDSGDDLAYFRAIESAFLRLRGAPLLLSPADFQVAREWRREGIPLEVVVEALRELFARRRERGTLGRVSSLRYCRPAVEAAWRRVESLVAAGERGAAVPIDPRQRLAALANTLPGELPGRRALSEAIRSLDGTVDEIESALEALDAAMLSASRDALSDDLATTIATAVDRRLEELAARLGEAELEEVRGRLEGRELRRRLGLPLLSLFSPDAQDSPAKG